MKKNTLNLPLAKKIEQISEIKNSFFTIMASVKRTSIAENKTNTLLLRHIFVEIVGYSRTAQNKMCNTIEGTEGVKWELGLAGFALGKWSSSHTGTGIWSLEMGKNVKNQKW